MFALVLAFGLVTLAMRGDWLRSETAAAASGGPEMRLEIIAGSGGFCDVINVNDCYAGVGSTFTLAINVVTAPVAGYIAIAPNIYFGDYDPTASEDGAGPNTCSDGNYNGDADDFDRWDTDCTNVELTYLPRPTAGDEFVAAPLRVAFRNDALLGLVSQAGLTWITPPLPTTYFEGRVLELDMSCPATPVTTSIDLLPFANPVINMNGSHFVEPDAQAETAAKVNSITVNCVSPQPFPGDTDGDGCADAKEEGSDPALGGDRDFLNPWDFYDVNGDLLISLFGDVLPVIVHQGTAPGPPYDVIYDRGPWQGVNSWNDTLPPDGVIDEPNDVDGVNAQYGHNCN